MYSYFNITTQLHMVSRRTDVVCSPDEPCRNTQAAVATLRATKHAMPHVFRKLREGQRRGSSHAKLFVRVRHSDTRTKCAPHAGAPLAATENRCDRNSKHKKIDLSRTKRWNCYFHSSHRMESNGETWRRVESFIRKIRVFYLLGLKKDLSDI